MIQLGDAVPWFLPGVAISLGVSLAASGSVSRILGVRRLLAWLIVVGLGLILSATLTPHRDALECGAASPGHCNVSRIAFASAGEYFAGNEATGNVLMFIPLGIMIAILPRSHSKLIALLAAIALPFAIEATQLLVPVLGRACESGDVIDNLLGLAIGQALGAAPGVIVSRGRLDPQIR